MSAEMILHIWYQMSSVFMFISSFLISASFLVLVTLLIERYQLIFPFILGK